MLRALLILATLPLAAAAQDDEHVTEVEGLRILHAWTNAGTEATAEVYMELENGGDEPVSLAEIAAPAAEIGTIVASPVRAAGGVPETLDGLLLPPGVTTVLEPRGIYVLLSGVEAPREEGDVLDLTLVFDRLGEVEVPVLVEAADATEHSHAGHDH